MSRSSRHKSLSFVESLIDHAKSHRGLRSDSQLAEALGVTRAMMSWVKTGRCGISAAMLRVLLDGYGEPVERNDLLALMPGDVVGVIRQHDLLMAQSLVAAPVLRKSRAGQREQA